MAIGHCGQEPDAGEAEALVQTKRGRVVGIDGKPVAGLEIMNVFVRELKEKK